MSMRTLMMLTPEELREVADRREEETKAVSSLWLKARRGTETKEDRARFRRAIKALNDTIGRLERKLR